MDEQKKIEPESPDSKCSRFPGFYRRSVSDRLEDLDSWVELSTEEKWLLKKETLTVEKANMLIENVIGVFGMPLGLAVNFRINEKDYVVPMAVEETSIVAAASRAAKLIRDFGKITAESSDPIMEGQIQVVGVSDPDSAVQRIERSKEHLIKLANKQDPILVSLGGGARNIYVKKIDSESGVMLIVHMEVDVVDAMGANAVNTMVETLGPAVAELSDGEIICQIISNLCDKSVTTAEFEIDTACLETEQYSGTEVAERIVKAYHFADADPYRAVTHNKGVMNAVDAILIATGNDWRAVEAASHAFAVRDGNYRSLTRYRLENDRLIGSIKLPLAVGIVGGVTKLHAGVQITLKLLGVTSRRELSEVIATVGLVQNFSALNALVTEGIQAGHMTLHARNVAYSAGAFGSMAIEVANQMAREGRIRFDRAKEIMSRLLAQKKEE